MLSEEEREAYREAAEVRRRLREAERREAVTRVKKLAEDGFTVRQAAKAMGRNKAAVMRYRREAGLTPPPPLRHLGGGKWVRGDDEDRDAPSRPFSRGRRGR